MGSFRRRVVWWVLCGEWLRGVEIREIGGIVSGGFIYLSERW